MIRPRFARLWGFALAANLAAIATTAAAQGAPSDYNRLAADVAKLQQDVREQRQLILQLMEMHSALLRYLQSGGTGGAGLPSLPTLPTPPSSTGGRERASTESESHAEMAPSHTASTGTITGTVRIKGGELGEAYVYLDGPKTLPVHAKSVEIKQDHKQFIPGLAVVQVGTKILFPNEDKVFHNTFSRTPGDAFDLGTLKAGDRPNPVVFMTAGHVEVFCNIHSKMRADILVVPNAHWARVREDGTFQLPGIPVGPRQVVLWGPRLKQVSQRLEVTPAGVAATFLTEAITPAPHLNKHGGEYGSYED